MSFISKDALIQACADVYKTASGESSVKAGELATKLASLISNNETGAGNHGIYVGYYTPTTDTRTINVVHNLGTDDILMAAIFAETLGDKVPTYACALSVVYLKTDYSHYGSSAFSSESSMTLCSRYRTSDGKSQIGSITSAAYLPTISEDSVIFQPAGAAASTYCAGVTYTAIIIPSSIKEALIC